MGSLPFPESRAGYPLCVRHLSLDGFRLGLLPRFSGRIFNCSQGFGGNSIGLPAGCSRSNIAVGFCQKYGYVPARRRCYRKQVIDKLASLDGKP